MFEDTKGVIRRCKLKYKQYNDQKGQTDKQNPIQKTKLFSNMNPT